MRTQPGQILVRPKLGAPAGFHQGVAISDGVGFHNTVENGAHFATYDSFEAGQPVWPTSPPASTTEDYERIVRRAQELAGTPYNALMFNCEDTASEVRFGMPRSRTREVIVLVVLVTLGIVLVAKVLGRQRFLQMLL